MSASEPPGARRDRATLARIRPRGFTPPPQHIDLAARDAIAAHLLEKARPQMAAASEPLAAAIGVPGVPPHPRPRPAPVAFVRLQVREPAEGRMGMRLVGEQEGPLVAAPAVVAVEKPGQAQ